MIIPTETLNTKKRVSNCLDRTDEHYKCSPHPNGMPVNFIASYSNYPQLLDVRLYRMETEYR